MVEKTYWFVNSLTGRRELQAFPAAGNWRSKISAVDSPTTHTFLVRDANAHIDFDAWEAALQPWSMRLVAEWDGVVKYAGWVLGDDWDAASGRLQVKHADFRAIAARRALFGIGPVKGMPDIVVAGRSLRGLMGEYAWYALVNGGYRWALRLVIDAADRFEAGPYTETIERFRLDTLESLLKGIETRDGGPESHFYARWSPVDGALEDVLRIGNPTLTTNTLEVIDSPETPIRGFGYTRTGENQRTGVWGVAQGRGDDGIIGLAQNVDGPETPILDGKHEIKDTQDQDVADSQAMGILRALRRPIKQYRFRIASEELSAQAEIGTRVHAYYRGDERQPKGWIDGRVIASSHTVGRRFLDLEVQ